MRLTRCAGQKGAFNGQGRTAGQGHRHHGRRQQHGPLAVTGPRRVRHEIACLDLNAEGTEDGRGHRCRGRLRRPTRSTSPTRPPVLHRRRHRAELGTIYGWVNCAGVSKMVPFRVQRARPHDDVNLKGVPHLPDRGGQDAREQVKGSIVASPHLRPRGQLLAAGVCSSKFGVIGLAVHRRGGCRRRHPPEHDLPGHRPHRDVGRPQDAVLQEEGLRTGRLFDHFINRADAPSCERADVTNAALFLLTSDSSYLTGQWIVLAGGDHME